MTLHIGAILKLSKMIQKVCTKPKNADHTYSTFVPINTLAVRNQKQSQKMAWDHQSARPS
jgi:hypothetical protein